MKIIFLSDDFPPTSFGGAGISTYELAKGVQKAGHEVFIITTCRKESGVGESEYDGLKVYTIASDYHERWRAWVSLYNPKVVCHVEELLKEIQPDVVHANNIHFHLSYYCLKAAKRYAKAVVFTARDTMAFTYGKLSTKRYLNNFDARISWLDNLKQAGKRWNPLRNFCIKRYLGYADKIFSVSDALKKALEQNGIKNVETMHTGADVSQWQVPQDQIVGFKAKYGLVNKKVLLFGGRLSTSKGADIALGILDSLKKEIPDAVLLIVGDGDAGVFKSMQKNHIKFTGWIEREEMKTVYAAANIVLVPSLYLDAFPRTVVEAMASERPVIGTCYGGAPEIIEDDVTGYVVNPIHIKEVAEKTLALLRDTALAKRFGKAGRERVRATFNLKSYVEQYLNWYERLVRMP